MNKVAGKSFYILLSVVVFVLFGADTAHATADFTNLSQNIVTSISDLPGLISAAAYMLGLVLGVLGILKLKDHVENPNQAQLKEGVIRLLAGGALFALPIIYRAMTETIGIGGVSPDGTDDALDVMGAAPAANTFNDILNNIGLSFWGAPALISAVAYLVGLVLGVHGILKLKDHVENPNQVQLKEGVIRLLAGGALFALPIVFEAMKGTIDGGFAVGVFGTADMSASTEAAGGCDGATIGGPRLSGVICNIYASTSSLPLFFTATAYLFGLILGVWGILKLKDHVENPNQVPVWDGVARLIAGGAMFALPSAVQVVYNSVGNALGWHTNTGFDDGGVSAGGLDSVLVNFMTDIFAPMNVLINGACYIAGIVLVMIGISRLMKSAQEGPRGPGGIGTVMTFVTAGALLAFAPMITAASTSLFGAAGTQTETVVALGYTGGLDATEQGHIRAVLSTVLKFMMVLGMIAVARGIFVIRAVAEGSQQASMTVALTHIIGGALAINLGPLLDAVQASLNIAVPGLTFG